MLHEETNRLRPRPEARVAQSMVAVHLDREVLSLRSEPGWESKGHNAWTLVKRSDSAIVLTILRKGQRLKEHVVPGSVAIQVLSGRTLVHVGAERVELEGGDLLALEPELAHDVEALDDTALLLTICA